MRAAKLPIRALSDRQQFLDERGTRGLDQPVVGLHAPAAIQHDDDGDWLDLVGEDRDRLQLAVVVDLEVVLREVRDQPAGRIGDRRVDRHGPGATLERLLGGREGEAERQRKRGREQQGPPGRRGRQS